MRIYVPLDKNASDSENLRTIQEAVEAARAARAARLAAADEAEGESYGVAEEPSVEEPSDLT